MLELHDVTIRYGAVRALDHVTLTAAQGAITAVLGANGAGKTTLLRAISGLVRPVSGTISYNDRTISGRRVEDITRMGIAHVPEGRGVITELTVEENLRLGGLVGKGGRLPDVYDLFPVLKDRRNRLASTLSGGERQMLAIGRALMSRPELLLLDEPSLGLAPRGVAQILRVLRRLRDETGQTVLLVEQNARSALSVADRAVVLSLGAVVIDDQAGRLAGDDQLRHAYLGF
jgi:branched-chain amino acid transport system ATP-binding protein